MEKNQAIQLFWVDVSRAVSNAKANKLHVSMERFSSDRSVEFRLIAGESTKELELKELKSFIAVGTLFVAAVLLGVLFSFVIKNHTLSPVEKATSEAKKKLFLECVEAWRERGYNPDYVNSTCKETVNIHEDL